MKTTYQIKKIINTYAVLKDGKTVATGDLDAMRATFRRRVASAVSAVKQHHGQEPTVEVHLDDDNLETVILAWSQAKEEVELRCLELPKSAWQRLDHLAETTRSHARSGPRHGQPSWRALIRRIADGELQIVQPEPAAEKK